MESKLPIGTKVTIKTSGGYGEASGKEKVITSHIKYGKQQGYRLGKNENEIWLEEDFVKIVKPS